MKGIFKVMILTTMAAASACQKDDEILPMPPATSTDAPVSPLETPEISLPPLDLTSEQYQYGKYMRMPYRILLPRNYNLAQVYPLHIFLHGIGESGTDNEKQLSLGASFFQSDSIRENYPAIIVFPQCPVSYYWSDETITQTLRGLIDSLPKNYGVDSSKVTISGFSMGAFGTHAMVARNPELFAAAVAISGGGSEDDAGLMAKTKWQIFAGKKDNVVSSSQSEKMAKALLKAGATVSFTLYPDADHHNTWAKAFSEPGLFEWLFSTKRED
jgi:predicted peptidase